ncbi:hypothetical protein C5167_024377 [Papaver somniferum]|uniref:Uncharacterized protein n=1 Tax=Papaver somniferum TaxID=3469 RepID=A0A4Y7JRI6_PAPSO|nr:uncharacterized protein LOC113283360 [Papaver somniferum]RZC62642.1 hypothetical protein C5167_024377 [Papaver somniferum]
MNEYTSGGPNPWYMYTTRDPSNPLSQTQPGVINPDLGQLPKSTVGGGINSSPPSPVNAISFGFVATAILIVMFLAMAFFEHLLRQRIPSLSSSSPQGSAEEAAHSLESGQEQPRDGIHMFGKMRSPQNVWNSYPNTDVSVLMPGNNCATFIAQPAPLPCRREGIHWSSSYDHSFAT